MKKIHVMIISVLFALVSQTAFAGGDAAAGKQKAGVCAGCHGADGNSPAANFPRLAGQYKTYIVKALEDYRSGERKDPSMAGFAANLSDQDIADLAAWFASQKGLGIIEAD